MSGVTERGTCVLLNPLDGFRLGDRYRYERVAEWYGSVYRVYYPVPADDLPTAPMRSCYQLRPYLFDVFFRAERGEATDDGTA
jgi:hypothetical protein